MAIRKTAIFIYLSLTLLTACSSGGGAGDTNNVIGGEFPIELDTVPDDNLVPASEQRIILQDDAFAFRANGKYATVLKNCAHASIDALCTMSTLPYIGLEHENPSVDDVLDRLVVTHSWMGIRFAQLLYSLPDDILPLFRSVNVIVIGSDVRPSSYSRNRALIRLDPKFLWLTLSEKRTIDIAPDNRLGFGPDLRFVSRNRYMNGDNYAFPSHSLTNDSERTLSEIRVSAARLLYHELAHAVDYVRPDFFDAITANQTPQDVVDANILRSISRELYIDESLTLQASPMYSLGQVRYKNTEPTDFEKTVLAETIGGYMRQQGKARFYAFASPFEDVATLFEASMMKLHFDADLHVMFADKPPRYPEDYSCNDLIVAWGERNRLDAPLVRQRARVVVDKVRGQSAETDILFDNILGDTVPLAEGVGWCDSQYLNSSVGASNSNTKNTLDNAHRMQQQSIEHAMQQEHLRLLQSD